MIILHIKNSDVEYYSYIMVLVSGLTEEAKTNVILNMNKSVVKSYLNVTLDYIFDK